MLWIRIGSALVNLGLMESADYAKNGTDVELRMMSGKVLTVTPDKGYSVGAVLETINRLVPVNEACGAHVTVSVK